MVLSRANYRRVAWVGLFALWLQLALSFGHIHPEDFAGLGGSSGAPVAQAARDRSAPSAPCSDSLAHEACAICAAMALAGCLVLPDPAPAPAPPPPSRSQSLPIPGAFALAGTIYRLFETRAPPVI